MTASVDVSIILPCYNAATYVLDSVREIEEVLSGTTYTYELIFVDDHSRDDTASVIESLIHGKDNCFLHVHATNLGKGRTLRDGFAAARGAIIGYVDLDLDNPAHYIYVMIQTVGKKGFDVSTALRVYRLGPNPYLLLRFLASRSYALLVRLLLRTGLQDVETGCKFFRRERIQKVMEETVSDGWFWDTEIMVRAHHAGCSICEVPTLYLRKTGVSTVRLVRDTLHYLKNLVRFMPVNRELRRRARYCQAPEARI